MKRGFVFRESQSYSHDAIPSEQHRLRFILCLFRYNKMNIKHGFQRTENIFTLREFRKIPDPMTKLLISLLREERIADFPIA